MIVMIVHPLTSVYQVAPVLLKNLPYKISASSEYLFKNIIMQYLWHILAVYYVHYIMLVQWKIKKNNNKNKTERIEIKFIKQYSDSNKIINFYISKHIHIFIKTIKT